MAKSDWTTDVAYEAFQQITDTFTALDGGVTFFNFMTAMQELDRRADTDYNAGKLVDIMIKFSALINITTRPQVEEQDSE